MGDTTVQTGQQPNTHGQSDSAPQHKPPVPAFAPAPTTAPPAGDQKPASNNDDEPLGPAGKRALLAERARVDELKQELAELAPLKQLAAALGNGDQSQGKSEVEKLNEKFAKYEQELAEERKGRLREQVARRFDLPDDLAELLKGDNEDELKAHAEVLKKYAPAKQETGKTRPKPDRSQGGGDANGHVSARQQGLDQAKKRFGDRTKTTT